MTTSSKKTYIVEHLDPELEAWSALEYKCIAQESAAANSSFFLTSVPKTLQLPANLKSVSALHIEHRGVEELYADSKDRVCLLDPSAKQELSPEDGDKFDVFLFGGILGDDPPRGKTTHPNPTVLLLLCVWISDAYKSDRSHVRTPQEGLPRPPSGSNPDDHRHRGPHNQDGRAGPRRAREHQIRRSP